MDYGLNCYRSKNVRFFLISVCFSIYILSDIVSAQGIEIYRFEAEEVRQGVAVDESFVYVIGTQSIGKYDKKSFEKIKTWKGEPSGRIIHLDSGMILEDRLYCAHSNYPGVPMTSSVEVWDKNTLKHIDSHSFGIYRGSCTWIDRHKNSWWAVFAHYDKWKSKTLKGTEWTTLVQFDDDWNELSSWIFPKAVIEEFRPKSNSGGSWGPDGLLYCTGHDSTELYVLRLPQVGSVLELVKKVQVPFLGQGIAWDRTRDDEIYGIRKKEKVVIRAKFTEINNQSY
jgi:hypothetical protein